MRRTALVVNLALLAFAAVALWRVQVNHQRWQQRADALTNVRATALPVETVATIAAPVVTPAAYADIALHSLFSRDRQADVIVETPAPVVTPPPPVPAFPRAYGVMDLGQGPLALLAWGDARQRAYQRGDTLGPWKLVNITPDSLTLEWSAEGRQFEKTLAELRAPDAASAGPDANIEAPKPVREEYSGDGPGPATGPSQRACKTGDRAPAGAVVAGFRKVISPTPFGNVCRWEAVSATGGRA